MRLEWGTTLGSHAHTTRRRRTDLQDTKLVIWYDSFLARVTNMKQPVIIQFRRRRFRRALVWTFTCVCVCIETEHVPLLNFKWIHHINTPGVYTTIKGVISWVTTQIRFNRSLNAGHWPPIDTMDIGGNGQTGWDESTDGVANCGVIYNQ